MTPSVDLVIAGAGPAGLAAAIQAAQSGLDVTVLDPRGGEVIDAASGEGIMPGGVEALDELGVYLRGVPLVGVEYADAYAPDRIAAGTFPFGAGLGVRRAVLCDAMRRRAQLFGARVLRGRVTSIAQRSRGVLVNGELRARWLVGADGLRSKVRRMLGVERQARVPARLGVRQHYAVRPWSDRVQVHFGERAEAYVTPVDASLVGVALLFERRRGEVTFDALLAGFPLLARRLEGRPVASRLCRAGPFERRVARRVVGDVLLVGDAAGYVDPLTGDGVALGLATARAAVTSLLEQEPSAYEARYRSLTRRHVALTSALLAITRRCALRRPLIHLARAWPAAFDAVLGMLGRVPSEDSVAPAWPGGDVTLGLDRLL